MDLNVVKSNKKVIGTKQTIRALKLNLVKEVYIAKDAEKRVVSKVEDLARELGVPVIYAETMKELGKISEIEVGSASVALLK